eukprot:scaffold16638_cov117-Cylindrotheca_fusiformis.AAC.1
MVVRGPKTAGRDRLSPSGQMFKLAGKAKNISTHENVGRGCHRRAWHQSVYECPSVPWWRVSHA